MPSSPSHFSHNKGFVPLSNQASDNRPTMAGDQVGIPLSQMRTAGSSTGARKANQVDVYEDAVSSSVDNNGDNNSNSSNNEKRTTLFAGRRRVKRDGDNIARSGTTDSEVDVTFMGKLYTRIVATSVITRYLIYIIPVAFLLAIPLVILPVTGNANAVPLGHLTTNATTKPPTVVEGPPLFHLFIWFESTWAGLWAGKLVAHFLPAVFMFFCGVVSSGTRKYATVLRNLEVPFSLFFWSLTSWLVFKYLFKDDRFQWIYVIKNILGALFASSAVFLAEKAIIQLVSITYHQRSFANRIKDSKREVHLLGLMYDASRTLFPMYCAEFEEEDYIINDSIDVMLAGKYGRVDGSNSPNGGKRGTRFGAPAPMRLVGNVGRFGDKVTSVFGNLASEITGKNVFNPNAAHSIVVEALEKNRTSEALARRIWMSFVVEDNDSLSLEDFEEVLGPAHKEDAAECFAAIDADGNGDISLDEMVRKVIDIGKERKAIANSMKDIGQALSVFDTILLFLVLLIVVFIFLSFFQSSFITTLATAGTALLSLSFVFAVTTQEVLGSCIFLFVKHPFDVGDRVDINGPEKEQLIVEKISLLFTVFVRLDKMQVVQVPNIVLNALWIENISRSKAMQETITVNVSYDTSFDDVDLLRQEMEVFVRDPDNARDFHRDVGVSVAGVGDLDKLQLNVTMKHKSNWHDDAVRATRRSKFMCALATALKKVPIYAPAGGCEPLGGPGNPSYTVAVSDEVAIAARDKYDQDKDEKRMVPLKGEETDKEKTGKRAEKQAEKQAEPWGVALDDDYHTLHEQSRSSSIDHGDTRPLTKMTSKASTAAGGRLPKHQMSSASQQSHQTTTGRGRRQAGQGLPARTPLDEIDIDLDGHLDGGHTATATAVQLSRYGSTASTMRRGGPSLDLERGESQSIPTAQGVSYTAYAPAQPHPLQSAPMMQQQQHSQQPQPQPQQQQQPPPTGRRRGPSVSVTQPTPYPPRSGA